MDHSFFRSNMIRIYFFLDRIIFTVAHLSHNHSSSSPNTNCKSTKMGVIATFSSSPIIGILGNGEIGSSLNRVYDIAGYKNVVIRDPYVGLEDSLEECDIVNICIPFFGYDKFVNSLKELNLKKNCIIIIQSTIGIGATDKVQGDMEDQIVFHSPVRGVHPNLTEGMITFEKYLGLSEKHFENKELTEYVRNHIVSLNMKPVMCRAMESELAKMVSTTLYGINIAAVTDVASLCEKHDVDFGTVFTRWQTGYNEGYTKLGKPNVCRPVLTPIKKDEDGTQVCGGHCVIPNSVILKNSGGESLAEFVLRYSKEESRVHVTGAKH